MRLLRRASLLTLTAIFGLLTACSGPRWSADKPGFDPLKVLVVQEQQAAGSAEQARDVLRAVSMAREKYGADLVLEKIACYQDVLVSGCLERVAARGRQLEARLDKIEVRASQRIRDLAAIERSQREAQSIQEQHAQEGERLASEARNRERYLERQRQAQEAEAERQAQAPELLRREQAQRERQFERERAFEQRKQQAQPAAPAR